MASQEWSQQRGNVANSAYTHTHIYSTFNYTLLHHHYIIWMPSILVLTAQIWEELTCMLCMAVIPGSSVQSLL